MSAVIAELKNLRNVHYNERPVSLFGGMVDLPLIVHRPDGRAMFDHAEREHATGGHLWAQFDAEQTAGTAAMERELRDNVLGDNAGTPSTSPPAGAWRAPRSCFASAEAIRHSISPP